MQQSLRSYAILSSIGAQCLSALLRRSAIGFLVAYCHGARWPRPLGGRRPTAADWWPPPSGRPSATAVGRPWPSGRRLSAAARRLPPSGRRPAAAARQPPTGGPLPGGRRPAAVARWPLPGGCSPAAAAHWPPPGGRCLVAPPGHSGRLAGARRGVRGDRVAGRLAGRCSLCVLSLVAN